jgi:hypothetical protein
VSCACRSPPGDMVGFELDVDFKMSGELLHCAIAC